MTEASEGGTGAVDPTSGQVALADVDHFLKYLRRAVPICLEEDAVQSPAFEAALADRNHLEAVKRFIGDPQTRAIFIQRSSSKGQPSVHSPAGFYCLSQLVSGWFRLSLFAE